MAKPKIVLNSAGMRDLLKSSGVRAALHDEADPILAEFKRRAPVDTGAYRDSGKIVDDTTDRAVVRVIVTDPKAMIIESRLGVLSRSVKGKALARSRERARERARDRAYDRARQREEGGWF